VFVSFFLCTPQNTFLFQFLLRGRNYSSPSTNWFRFWFWFIVVYKNDRLSTSCMQRDREREEKRGWRRVEESWKSEGFEENERKEGFKQEMIWCEEEKEMSGWCLEWQWSLHLAFTQDLVEGQFESEWQRFEGLKWSRRCICLNQETFPVLSKDVSMAFLRRLLMKETKMQLEKIWICREVILINWTISWGIYFLESLKIQLRRGLKGNHWVKTFWQKRQFF
jgi:hypothetical protein